MQNPEYRSILEDAVKNLEMANQTIFNSMIDLAMQGELKDWNETVPVGESHFFDMDIFRNSNDINLRLLAGIIEFIDNSIVSLRNLNHLQEET